MPYDIIWNAHFVTFNYHGHVTSQDLIESNQEVYGDPRFDLLHWELVCFDETESVSFNPANVRLIAYMDQAAAKSNSKITIAFVGKTKIIEEVEAAYSNTGVEPAWALIHFDNREEAISYITQNDT